MRPLGDALAAAGFPAVGVQLPGHGTTPEALAQVGHGDWIDEVLGAIARLEDEGRRVALAGLSMGALLALLAAARRPRAVAALVLCGPALALANRWIEWLPVLERIPGLARLQPLLPRGGTRGISDPALRAASPTYDRIPWRAVRELLALRRAARAVLPALDHPTLVLHGRHDRSVPVGVIDELRAALGSAWIESHVLERSAHVVTMDVERERVAELVVDFLGRVEAAR